MPKAVGDMKICSRCREDLPLSAYGKNKQAPDGLQYTCKKCIRERRRPLPVPGPPVKLDETLADELLTMIREGLPFQMVAEGLGISVDTFATWRAKAKAREEPYQSLLKDLKRAELDAYRQFNGTVVEGDKSWQSGAWLLERRQPNHYRRDRIEEAPPKPTRSLDEVLKEIGVDNLKAIISKMEAEQTTDD